MCTPQSGEPGGDPRNSNASASSGGTTGFFNDHIETAWDVVAGQAQTLTDLREHLELLENNYLTRAGANLKAIERFRDQLSRVPADAAMGDPVVLRLQDAVVLMRLLMQKLR